MITASEVISFESFSTPSLPPLPLQATIAAITELQTAAGIKETSLLNFVVSDGITTVATRYASEGSQAATLYYAEGGSFERVADSVPRSGEAEARGSASTPVLARGTSVKGAKSYFLLGSIYPRQETHGQGSGILDPRHK